MTLGIDARAVCYLSVRGDAGRWAPLAEASVPVLDRGFILGDGVYEVIPVYEDRAFRLRQHLRRLRRSLAEVSIADPLDEPGWTLLVAELVRRNRALGADLVAYLQVTRGVAPREHAFPASAKPTVFGMASRWTPPGAGQIADGVVAVTMDDPRWQRCDIKTISLIANVLARQYAADQGAAETLLLRDDHLTEGAASNVWIVKDGVLRTPPAGEAMLEGIRIDLLSELARDAGIACVRGQVSRDVLMAADEVLLTSAGRELLAVTRIDDWPVGDGKPGPVFRRLYAAYQDAKRDDRHCVRLDHVRAPRPGPAGAR